MSTGSPSGKVRPAAQAGRFYPAQPDCLRQEVEALLASASPLAGPAPKALIAPHAGYAYSGPVAASAYAALSPVAATVRRVILLGPSHALDFTGLAVSAATGFSTPLGVVPLDQERLSQLLQRRGVAVLDSAHGPEHSLEVHLPFLQVLLPGFTLVPLLVGRTSPAEVGEVLESLWDGPSTRIVVSSDLSHFHDYDTAQARDAATAAQIRRLAGEDLTGRDACGYRAVRGLLHAARSRDLRCRVLDLRNSGDTAGGHDRVVGYGAFAFDEPGS